MFNLILFDTGKRLRCRGVGGGLAHTLHASNTPSPDMLTDTPSPLQPWMRHFLNSALPLRVMLTPTGLQS